MPDNRKTQQLHASNMSVTIGEALEARVKDPLWFLARQWQSGEFEAENGGRVAYASVQSQDFPLETVQIGDAEETLDLHAPLESVVEKESAFGDAPAWQSEALEYRFGVETKKHRLEAHEYAGRHLDWYNFDFDRFKNADGTESESRRVTPTQLYFRGAPHPRWWRFEEGEAYFDSPKDPEPNILSVLLPEFFYTDINNWYIIPALIRAGSLREVSEMVVVDSFGHATRLNPAVREDTVDNWNLFVLDGSEDNNSDQLDGRFLFVPNIALDVLHNADIEDVRFLRDEDANLVWAWEHRYTTSNGDVVINGDGIEAQPDDQNEENSDASLPRFVLKSTTLPHWIPYVPRQKAANGVLDGEIYLRRARTVETASSSSPQYNSSNSRYPAAHFTSTGIRA